MILDTVRISYYLIGIAIALGGMVGAYFTALAGVRKGLQEVIRRQDEADSSLKSIQEAIVALNRDLGRLEGRLNHGHR